MNEGGSIRRDGTGKVIEQKQTKPEARNPKTNKRVRSDADRRKDKNLDYVASEAAPDAESTPAAEQKQEPAATAEKQSSSGSRQGTQSESSNQEKSK